MKIIPVASFAIRNKEGKWLLRKRPEAGLLASMWEFPMIELNEGKASQDKLAKQMGIELTEANEIMSFKHIFSHLTWEMQSYFVQLKQANTAPKGYQYFTDEEVEALPKPVPVLKIWESLNRGGKLND